MQAEYFDAPGRPEPEVAEFYSALSRMNRMFAFAYPFQRFVPGLVGTERCRKLSILDLGAGDGSLGEVLHEWAAARGWDWRFTNLDVSVPALRLGAAQRRVAASAVALPFADGSFDVVIASQMTHHIESEQDVRRHLSEGWRVTRCAMVLSDLHRGMLLYGLLWVLFHLRKYPRHFREDGLLSVKRGFLASEWRRLAQEAGIDGAQVRVHYGTRIVLEARKAGF